jgi:hypothetical protein
MKSLIATVALMAATAGTALAQPGLSDGEPLPTAPAPKTTEWYGWEILTADGAAFTVAAATHHGEIALAWIGTGAVVHASHDNYGRSAVSVLLRVGLPVLGASLGAANSHGCSGDWCGLNDVVAGGLIGMGTAEVIDVVMANEEHEVAPARPARPARGWTPVASVRHSGATVGFSAQF